MAKKKVKKASWHRKPKNAPSATEALAFIEGIKEKKGGLTPQLLVIESQPKKSPLHNCFEWDNTKAAKEYRIIQAQKIIRFLYIEVEPDDDESSYVRAIVSPKDIEQPSNTSWMPIQEVIKNADYSNAYARQILNRLIEAKRTIKNFKNARITKKFAKVVKEIDAVKI